MDLNTPFNQLGKNVERLPHSLLKTRKKEITPDRPDNYLAHISFYQKDKFIDDDDPTKKLNFVDIKDQIQGNIDKIKEEEFKKKLEQQKKEQLLQLAKDVANSDSDSDENDHEDHEMADDV